MGYTLKPTKNAVWKRWLTEKVQQCGMAAESSSQVVTSVLHVTTDCRATPFKAYLLALSTIKLCWFILKPLQNGEITNNAILHFFGYKKTDHLDTVPIHTSCVCWVYCAVLRNVPACVITALSTKWRWDNIDKIWKYWHVCFHYIL